MNDQKSLYDQLLLATSRKPLVRGDYETRSLQAAYQSLAEMLERAELPIDEEALIQATLRPEEIGPANCTSKFRNWLPILAVAASTLLLVSLARFGVQDGANQVAEYKTIEPALSWDDDWDERVAEIKIYSTSIDSPTLTTSELRSWSLGKDIENVESKWSLDPSM